MAPVSSMNVIWRIDVATISVIGKDAIKPARLEFKMVDKDVLKTKYAMNEIKSQPIKPTESAAMPFHRSKIKIRIMGDKAMSMNKIFINSPAVDIIKFITE
jgi:hypothetical protein